jgi:hypothetical protein
VVLYAGSLTIGPFVSYEATFSDLARCEVQTRHPAARVPKFNI